MGTRGWSRDGEMGKRKESRSREVAGGRRGQVIGGAKIHYFH